jgi:hypothetical protein
MFLFDSLKKQGWTDSHQVTQLDARPAHLLAHGATGKKVRLVARP